jgi:hypothetical protein
VYNVSIGKVNLGHVRPFGYSNFADSAGTLEEWFLDNDIQIAWLDKIIADLEHMIKEA